MTIRKPGLTLERHQEIGLEMIGDLERLVGARVRQMREERGWSQKYLSQRLTDTGWPIHQTNVSKLEAARRPIRVTDLEALAEAFGVPVIVFLWEQADRDADRHLKDAAAEVDRAHDQLMSAGVVYATALAERERLVRAVSESARDNQ